MPPCCARERRVSGCLETGCMRDCVSGWLKLAAGFLSVAMALTCSATVFGNLRGVVHDPQHHPVSGAHATLQASDSAYSLTAESDNDGEFHFDAVPLGKY